MHNQWSADKTVGISQIVAIIVLAITFFTWVTSIERKTDLNTRELEHFSRQTNEIDRRFDRIEKKLDRILERSN